MPDFREVYEMVTKQKPPEPGALERQQKRQVRTARNRRIGGYAAAAAVIGLVAAIAVILGTRGEPNTTTSAGEAPTMAPRPASGPFLLDLETGETRPLAESLAGGHSYVASPDGTRLAYGTGGTGRCEGNEVVKIVNLDGTNARTLRAPDGLNICGARWSPDGTKLVYQLRDGDDPYSVGNLFVHDLASGHRTQVTDLELTSAWWWFLSPRFVPTTWDFSSERAGGVIFHLPRDSNANTKWDVWTVSVTGAEPRLMLQDAAFPMLRSQGPEGLRVAFVSPKSNDFAGQSIVTGRPIPPGDLRQTLVEANSAIWWPTLSPDGDRIAYEDGGSIYVVDVYTGESSKVAEGNTAEWLDTHTLIVAP